jgi:hypothetical protein
MSVDNRQYIRFAICIEQPQTVLTVIRSGQNKRRNYLSVTAYAFGADFPHIHGGTVTDDACIVKAVTSLTSDYHVHA